jgi:hypothetical protein
VFGGWKIRLKSLHLIPPDYSFPCDPKDFTHTETHVWRNQKSGTVETPGFRRPDYGGGVELPHWNGLVPDEDERYGPNEVRRDAKRVWLRKLEAVQDHYDHEAGECAVLLALAAPRQRVPGAGGRKRSARIAIGAQPAQIS